jgi:hypothetical protein
MQSSSVSHRQQPRSPTASHRKRHPITRGLNRQARFRRRRHWWVSPISLVEREFFLAWLPVRGFHIELMSLESDLRWPVFIEKVNAAAQAGARATI